MNKKVAEHRGQRFGRLVVIAHVGFTQPDARGNRQAVWHCECDCGGFAKVRGSALTGGVTRSCGCLQRDKARAFCRNRWEAA